MASSLVIVIALAFAFSLAGASVTSSIVTEGTGSGRHWIVVEFTAAGNVHADISWQGSDTVGGGVGLYDSSGDLLSRQIGVMWIPQGDARLAAQAEPTAGIDEQVDGPDPLAVLGPQSWGARAWDSGLPQGDYVAVLWVAGWPGTWNYSVTASGGGALKRVTTGTEGTIFLTSMNFTGPTRLQASYFMLEASHVRSATAPLSVQNTLIGGDATLGGIGFAETKLVGEGTNIQCRCWPWDVKGPGALDAGSYAFVRNATQVLHNQGWHFTGLDFRWPA